MIETIGYNINQLEMLRMFGKFQKNHCVKLRIDNKAVLNALHKGKIRDSYMQAVARLIWLIAVSNDIRLLYSHIPGVNNVKADALSRLFERGVSHQKLFQDFI